MQAKTTKELARQYMQQRQVQHKAPTTIEEIRRQLGWNLLKTQH